MPRTYVPTPTLAQKAFFLLLLYFCKAAWSLAYTLVPPFLPALFPPPSTKKTYPPSRRAVWFYHPPSYPPLHGSKLPLYINIHGGALTYGTPRKDTLFCTRLTAQLGCVTASISYRNAPRHKFPVAIYDCAAMVECILSDPEYADIIDRERIVVGGFSAGGCISLALARLPQLRDTCRFRAVVAWYPKVDFTLTFAEECVGLAAQDVDPIMKLFKPAFDWAGARGVRLDDPLISPALHTTLETLPARVMVVAGKKDMFAAESERWIDHIVALRGGREVVSDSRWRKVVGDAGKVVGWWVEGVGHSFTHKLPRGDTMEALRAREVTREVVQGVGEWIRNVFDGTI